MAKSTGTLTTFGKDLDSLLKQAGNISIRAYADQAGVSYKYILQLRTKANRHPGWLYVNLLKPFISIKILDLDESHQFSIRHRGHPLTLAECRELFPKLPETELSASINRALKSEKPGAPPPTEDANAAQTSYSQLYRRVFVGRKQELNALRASFDSVNSIGGALVTVAGEPGIGKTALCEQLFSYVTKVGGKTIVGRCYDEVSIPYLPFVEALRSYFQGLDTVEQRKQLGARAADIARIVPEITERLKLQPRSLGNPEEEKYRLLQAVSEVLGNAAKTQPLLLVLEDMHQADKSTLEMLIYLCRNLKNYRLLVVITYRSAEVNRKHPLSATLAEVRRLTSFGRVQLRGLSAEEVSRMLSSITGYDAPSQITEAVYRQTDGNPLFVQEVARYLVEEGIITREDNVKQASPDRPIEISIPDGLREVIWKRLSCLSESCNSLLAVAAVIGREFRLDVLQRVAGISNEEIINDLSEAKRTGVIEEHIGSRGVTSYRFAHALFRQTLYDETVALKRIQLHQQVARELEKVYKNRLVEHTAELAEHYFQSSDKRDLKKAARYWEMAANRATEVYAWDEAVSILEQAIKAQEILDLDDKAKMCDLLLSKCEALLFAGEPRQILDTEAPSAFTLAEDLRSQERATRACSLALMALLFEGAGVVYPPETVQWIERANTWAENGTITRCHADLASGAMKLSKAGISHDTASWEKGIAQLESALTTARCLGDPETLWNVAYTYIFWARGLSYAEKRLQLAEEITATSRVGIRLTTLSPALTFTGYAFLEAGQRDQAEKVWQEHQGLTKRFRQPYYYINDAQIDSRLALLDGRLEEAVEICRNLMTRGNEMGLGQFATMVAVNGLATPLFHLGRGDEEFQLVKSLMPFPEHILTCLLHMGHENEVVSLLEQYLTTDPKTESIVALAAGVLVKNQKVVRILLDRITSSTQKISGVFWLTCIPRHLGGACALLGRNEEARKYYDEAVKVCTEMRFRPELALSRLQLAELLLEHYPKEKKEAVEHLDFCIKEFKEMKMQPSLEKALRHKEILKA